MPVWGTIGLMRAHGETKRAQEAKDKEKAALPLSIAICWTAIDNAMKNARASNADPFDKFEWAPSIENAYVLTTANEEFSDDKPVPIDSRVALRFGRVQFKIEGMNWRWTVRGC